MATLKHVLLLSLACIQLSASASVCKRKAGNLGTRDTVNATDPNEDARWPITTDFIDRNRTGILSATNATLSAGNQVLPDPYEVDDVSGNTKYGYRFYDYHGGIETIALTSAIFWSQWQIQSKLLQNRQPYPITSTTPYGSDFDWDRDRASFNIPSEWKQGQPLTYGDLHSILSTIWEFVDNWVVGKKPQVPMCRILVIRNGDQSGAQTMWINLATSMMGTVGGGSGSGVGIEAGYAITQELKASLKGNTTTQ